MKALCGDSTARISIDGVMKDIPLEKLTKGDLERCGPVREIRFYRGQLHRPGWYWSATNRALTIYESRHERDRLQLADWDTRVVAIRSQPFWLSGRDSDGRVRKHVPDFALLERDGSIRVVNVKIEKQLEKPTVQEALTWANGLLESHGFLTEVWTGEDTGVLRNIRLIGGYRNSAWFDSDEVTVAAEALSAGDWTVDKAEDALRNLGIKQPRPILLHLLWRQDLTFDMTTQLEGDTVLEAK